MNNLKPFLFFALLPLILLVRSYECLDPFWTTRYFALSIGTLLIGTIYFFSAKKIQLSFFHWLFISVVLYSCLTTYWSINTAESIFENQNLLSAFFFSLILFSVVQEKFNEDAFLKNIIIAIVIAELYASYTLIKLFKSEFTSFEGIYSITGNFGHKNLLSCFLAATLPFSIWVILKLKGNWKNVAAICIGLALFFIVLLQSRATWLGIIAFTFFSMGTLIYLKEFRNFLSCLNTMKKELAIAVLIPLLLIIGIFSAKPFLYSESSDHLQSVVDSPQDESRHSASIYERYFLWDNTKEMIKENPIKGVGAGSWKYYFPKYGVTGSRAEAGYTIFQRPHNDYLWVLSELGIIGFSILLFIMVFLIVIVFKTLRSSQDISIKRNVVLLSGTLIIIGTDSVFSFPKERAEMLVLLIITIVLVLHYGKVKTYSFSNKILIPIVGILILISFSSYKRIQGEKLSVKMIHDHSNNRFDRLTNFSNEAESFVYNNDPFLSPCKWYSGLSYFQQGDFKMAEIEFKKSCETHPYHLHSLNNLAGTYVQLGDLKSAEKYYLEALKISPHYDESLINLSSIYFNNNENNKAFEVIKKCYTNSKHVNYKRNVNVIFPLILEKRLRNNKINQNDRERYQEALNNPEKLFELFKEFVRNNGLPNY